MDASIFSWLIPVLRTISEALIAGVAIACFSVFLFLLSYLRKEYLARVYALILAELTIIFTANAFNLTARSPATLDLLQKIQGVGFFAVHAAFYHFSLTILEMTGRKLHRRSVFSIIVVYAVSFLLIGLYLSGIIDDPINLSTATNPNFGAFSFISLSWLWVISIFLICTGILFYASRRTKTRTGRRRMSYLMISAVIVQISTTLSIFAGLWLNHSNEWIFRLFSVFAYLILLLMIFLLAYAVVIFCVTCSHRVVRLRLIEWVLRGPVTAGLTLILITLVRRTTRFFDMNSEAWTSLLSVLSILICEYMITVLTPVMRRNNYSGYGSEDYEMLSGLENLMIFRAELETYLESLCSVLCDKLQTRGAFVAVFGINGQVETIIHAGAFPTDQLQMIRKIASTPIDDFEPKALDPVRQESGLAYLPIAYPIAGNEEESFLAMIGVRTTAAMTESELQEVLRSSANDCAQVLWQRRYFSRTYRTLENIAEEEPLQRYRSVNVLNPAEGFSHAETANAAEVFNAVREALTHYWGGPKLSESPLLSWCIVISENPTDNTHRTNDLKKVLRSAIEKLRPEGEPNYSVEWTLYNILILRFIEGRKVKEIVKKLAMSEADYYRKQRVAIEEVAKILATEENKQRQIDANEIKNAEIPSGEILNDEDSRS